MTQTRAGDAAAAQIGGPHDGPHRRARSARSCTTSSPPPTSTAAACACSCPTAPAAARCRCCCRRSTARCTGASRRLTVLVALGTHAAMSEQALAAHLGYEPGALGRPLSADDRAQPRVVGPVRRSRTSARSAPSGSPSCRTACCAHTAHVRINRAVVEHDVTLIVGPVFPHEVVGFSGGNKYLFPGVSGRELIDLSHWLGALITSAEIIGTRGITPVRALIDEAASLVPGERLALCVVTQSAHAATCTRSRSATRSAAWAAAADVSAETHVRYLDAPVRRVLSLIPAKYDDMWTGAKGFYKVEPVVADGGAGRALRAAHPRDQHHAPADRRDRLPLPRLLRQAVGPLQGPTTGATSPTPPTCAAPAPGTRSTASATGSRSRWPPASPRTSPARSTSTTSTRPTVDPGRLGGRPRHARRARRRRGPLPAALRTPHCHGRAKSSSATELRPDGRQTPVKCAKTAQSRIPPQKRNPACNRARGT